MDWQRLARAGTRRQMAMTALAGLLLGLGGVTAGTTLVQASERGGLFDFLESIFREPAPEPAAPQPRPSRYISLPDSRRVTATRAGQQTPRLPGPVALSRPGRHSRSKPPGIQPGPGPSVVLAGAALGGRTVCVRSCDGYLFPLGHLGARADLPVHAAACAAACPNTPTRLFTLGAGETELDRAVGLDGRPYRSLAVANLFRSRRVQHCSCQPDGKAAPPLPIARDLTVRAGDVIATGTSAGVVTPVRSGGFTVVDFREARSLSRRARREIDAKVDVIRREAELRAFRKALRSADRAGRIRVAAADVQAVPPPIEVEPPFASARNPAAKRIVMASPFVY